PLPVVVVDSRVGLSPVALQPFGCNGQGAGERRQVVRPQGGGPEVRQQTNVLASAERLERAFLDLVPVRRGKHTLTFEILRVRTRVGRGILTEQSKVVKRGQELRVFEVLAARLVR